MLEGRDANCLHSQQYLSVRDRWSWKIDELQSFITNELLRSHCTHFSSHVFREFVVSGYFEIIALCSEAGRISEGSRRSRSGIIPRWASSCRTNKRSRDHLPAPERVTTSARPMARR